MNKNDKVISETANELRAGEYKEKNIKKIIIMQKHVISVCKWRNIGKQTTKGPGSNNITAS